jgi:hypothetical protein
MPTSLIATSRAVNSATPDSGETDSVAKLVENSAVQFKVN